MFVEQWIFDKFEVQVELDTGKYLKHYTKECLSLNKSQAKYLNTLYNKLIFTKEDSLTCQTFQNFEILPLFHGVYLNKVLKEVELPKWNQLSLECKCDFTKKFTTILKEKVILTAESKLYLEKIISLQTRSLHVDPFEVKILYFQDTSYMVDLIHVPQYFHKREKLLIPDKYIATNKFPDIEQDVEQLNENEDFHLPSIENIIPKIPLVLMPFDTTDQYIFHIDAKKQNISNLTLPIDILIWNVKYNNCENNIISTLFKELELKLFDIEFHKFEFFKFACHQKFKNNLKQTKITTFWILSKMVLKQMKWSPFKKWNKPEIYEKFQDEKIPAVNFCMPIFITGAILYIPNTDLDLYERGKSSMKNLQINTEVVLYDKSDKALIETGRRRREHTSKDNIEGEDENVKNGSYRSVQSSILTEEFSDKTALTIPKKRSFLDSDLQAIIAKKKSQLTSNKKVSDQTDKMSQIYSTREDLTDIFQSGIFNDFENTIEASSIEQMGNIPDLSQFGSHMNNLLHESFPIDLFPKYNIKDKLIIFNSNRITNNYKLLQGLINQDIPSCAIIEREISTICDVILNSSTCVICLELTKFFQRQSSGSLYYLDILKDCLQEYKRIKIMFNYDPNLILYDNDTFWKIYLYLPFPRFELFFIPDGSISILVQYMNKLIWKEASTDISAADFEGGTDDEDRGFEEIGNDSQRVEDILLKLNFNPILAKILIKRYNNDLTSILLHINDGIDPYLLKIMTTSQIYRLKKLNSINW